jgi:hypothetical protein
MTTPNPSAEDFGYYSRTMVQLCAISYEDMGSIPNDVTNLGWDVVWGPAELVSWLDISYSLAFICQRQAAPQEYAVVIRGTNMMSWDSWELEDFAIGTTRPFNELAPHAPANALVSHGTFRGLVDLLKLRDTTRQNTGIVDFLTNKKPGSLFITGQSLGGTLAPPLFAYLNDVLYGGNPVTNMALWTFAGLTPGDANFNTYFNALFSRTFPWRFHNSLDIAPLSWWSLDGIRNIYSANGLSWRWPADDLIEDLFTRAQGKNYTQPVGRDQVLPGTFQQNIIDEYVWPAQAMYQHHISTYAGLVTTAFPESLASSA